MVDCDTDMEESVKNGRDLKVLVLRRMLWVPWRVDCKAGDDIMGLS